MGPDRADYRVFGQEKRPKRSPRTRSSRCIKWRFMDTANRSTLERSSSTISTIPNMPSTVPAMGQRRCFQTHCHRAGRRPVRTRRHWHSWSVHRRELRSGKKRGLAVGKTKRGKGTKIMAIADVSGFPVAAHIESASPHEVKLVEATVDSSFTPDAPDKLIGDKAYDSDKLDQTLAKDRGIEMIAPHKVNRKKPPTQDGRKLRRYVRRWKVERLFAWLYNFRRLVVRWEYHADNFLGFLQLGCAMILFRLFWDGL